MMRVVLVVAALWAHVALAQTADQSAQPDQPAQPDYLKWGAMLDVGIPDGAALSGVYRPFTWLRANAGMNYNLFGVGVHGGVSLVPFYFLITPSLNLEVGHFFEGNITRFAQQALPGTDLGKAGDALQHVGYNYGNAQLGLELGSPRRFIFFLRAGISYVQANISGFQQALQNASGDNSITAKPLKVQATIPSAKLGILVFF